MTYNMPGNKNSGRKKNPVTQSNTSQGNDSVSNALSPPILVPPPKLMVGRPKKAMFGASKWDSDEDDNANIDSPTQSSPDSCNVRVNKRTSLKSLSLNKAIGTALDVMPNGKLPTKSHSQTIPVTERK